MNSSADLHTRLSGPLSAFSPFYLLVPVNLSVGYKDYSYQPQKELSNSTSQLNSWLSLGDRERDWL